jgi:hypothetical protein
LESASYAKFETGTFGIGSSNEESERTNTTTASSSLKGKGIQISAGEDIKIQGSDIWSGEYGILMEAKGDINIIPSIEITKRTHKKDEGDVFNGREIDATYYEEGKIRGSSLSSLGNITLVAGNDIMSVSTEYAAAGDIDKYAGYVINEEGKLAKSGKEEKVKEYAAEGYVVDEHYHKKTDGLIGALGTWEVTIKCLIMG